MPISTDYESQMEALLPRGPIWRRSRGSTLDAVIYSAAREFARVDARLASVLDEADPRTSTEMLTEWFTDWGVPSDCIKAIANPTLEMMRQELIAKITSNQGLTADFFEGLAGVLGYDAAVTTFDTFTCASLCDARLYDENWRTTFVLGIAFAEDGHAKYFETTWTADQPLATWGNALLECLIKALAPAHVNVIFMYEGEDDDEGTLAS